MYFDASDIIPVKPEHPCGSQFHLGVPLSVTANPSPHFRRPLSYLVKADLILGLHGASH